MAKERLYTGAIRHLGMPYSSLKGLLCYVSGIQYHSEES